MKKLFIISILGIGCLLTGCSNKQSYENIVKRFPDCVITKTPEYDYRWIVRNTNGEVFYVLDYGTSDMTNLMYVVKLMYPINQ